MSQPSSRKVTLNTASDKGGKGDRQTMKRRRETENSTENVDINDSKIGDTIFPSDMPATGPTSFAGLIPTDNQDTQATRPARRIKTFQDVSRAATAAAAAAGLGAMLPLSQSDWLPPIMAPRSHKSGGGAADGAQAGQLDQQALATTAAAPTQIMGLELEESPMDWSLKTSLRFTSTHPFTLLETARTAPRSEVIDAERYFISCIVDTDTAPHQRLLAAAMTWQFPQNPHAPASSRPIGTSLPSHIQQRRKDWQESLCSVYDSLRTGHCTAFYLVSPQLPSGIGKQPFTVLFSTAGVKGSQRLQAVMGTSSAGVRSMLKMQGVEFETPLVLGINAANTTTGRSTISTIDQTTRSMLVFNGALQVHALFDFLLNRAFTLLDNVCDVPILLAPVQFTHAAIKKFNLTATSSSAPAVAVGGTGKGAARKGQVNTVHTLDLKGGVIPGWVSSRLLDVLTSEDSLNTRTSAAAPAAITMVSTPLPASIALNWHVSSSSSTNRNKNQVPTVHRCIGGCISDAEAKKWSATLQGLDTAAIKEIRFIPMSSEEAEGKGKGKKEKAGGRMYKIVQATNRILPITLQ